jgi:transmembrane sensor
MKRLALQAAAQWYAQLSSGTANIDDQQAWSAWHAANADHRWAWAQVEALQRRMSDHRAQLPSEVAARTFSIAEALPRESRRAVLKGFVLCAAVGGTAFSAWRHSPAWLAQYATATGEQREIVLADGSTLILNTASSVDVVFDANERRVKLYAGEILIQTASDPMRVDGASRRFVVETAHGEVEALGTRFTVRKMAESSEAAVLESAVEIRPAHSDMRRVLQAGQHADFSAYDIGEALALAEGHGSWREGMLVATDWPLAKLLAELERYRPGYLGCSEEAGRLRISGAFPIHDTDLALTAINKALPVNIVKRTRYWTTVTYDRT